MTLATSHNTSSYSVEGLRGEAAWGGLGRRCWKKRHRMPDDQAHTSGSLHPERDELRVVDDQFGAPTAARLIAEVTAACIGRLATGSPPASGVYHLAPHGETTWCRLARAALAAARLQGVPLRCTPEKVVGIGTADYPLPARRPSNSRLDTSKLETALNIRLPEWQDDVPAVVAALVTELPS